MRFLKNRKADVTGSVAGLHAAAEKFPRKSQGPEHVHILGVSPLILSISVDLVCGWQAKMASIETWIP